MSGSSTCWLPRGHSTLPAPINELSESTGFPHPPSPASLEQAVSWFFHDYGWPSRPSASLEVTVTLSTRVSDRNECLGKERTRKRVTVAADAEWTMSQTAYCTTLQHFAAPRSGFEGAAASIPTSDRCGPRGAGRQSTRSSACLVGVTPAASRQDSDESPDGPGSPRLGGARVSAHPSRGSGPRLGYGPGPETSATTTAPPARPPAAAAAGGGGAEMFRCRGSAGRPHEGNPLIG